MAFSTSSITEQSLWTLYVPKLRRRPRGLRMVLDALVGLDVLSKDDAGHYALTEESATFLVTGKPTYHGAFFLLTKEPMLSSWSRLDEVVKSGRSVRHINREQEGPSFFLRFVEDIFPIHYPGAQALARALGVQSEPVPISVLDLAAGSGVWSVAIAQQSPQIRVTAVDWPGVIPVTKKVTAATVSRTDTRSLPVTCTPRISVKDTGSQRSGTFFIARVRPVAGVW
jgi:hypothetical protein